MSVQPAVIGQQTHNGEPHLIDQIPAASGAENHPFVEQIANQVTVRILTKSAHGSGVIVAHKGRTYTVLTCQHVAAESKKGDYQVLVVDGKTYPGRLKSFKNSQKLDLALIEFESPRDYRPVAIGNLTKSVPGAKVYAAGFPNYHAIGRDNLENTQKLGRKVFKFTVGTVGLILSQPALPDGYSLGYTNDVELGMSGGPVLNDRGELLGINGRSKYPIQGIDAFTFADGTKPSVENFEKMEPLSWAVPIYKSLW
ncbi:MAG: serine protease [Chamaesiphon sp.]|nr:serine protease [Chamaesiphon sp.]